MSAPRARGPATIAAAFREVALPHSPATIDAAARSRPSRGTFVAGVGFAGKADFHLAPARCAGFASRGRLVEAVGDRDVVAFADLLVIIERATGAVRLVTDHPEALAAPDAATMARFAGESWMGDDELRAMRERPMPPAWKTESARVADAMGAVVGDHVRLMGARATDAVAGTPATCTSVHHCPGNPDTRLAHRVASWAVEAAGPVRRVPPVAGHRRLASNWVDGPAHLGVDNSRPRVAAITMQAALARAPGARCLAWLSETDAPGKLIRDAATRWTTRPSAPSEDDGADAGR